MKKIGVLLPLVFAVLKGNAQEDIQKTDTLKEVVVTSSRIDLPFKENSRTIQIISAEDIKKLGVTNVADALQQIAGIDVRRQGVNGMQSDLYIRGGSFDQTLLLIDGIKVDDAQTGHHTMNLQLPIEVIKRIEVIKGPAARIFGQNAYSGAINIVTKDAPDNSLVAKVQGGSFNQFLGEVTGTINMEKSSHLVHVSKNFSEGYRHNTDFDNTNVFVKSQFNKDKLPIDFIATLSERKFGANGFYGIASATEQYEETQASLIGFSTTIKKGNFTWKPKVYWRRNQDLYLYIRSNPSAYRNMHITNKVAAELNGSYQSKIGITGFGVEFSKYYIGSNRLGDNQREIASLFLEHRFQFFNNILDVTPGISVSYFSDFDNQVFPGLDLGVKISDKFRAYGNIGTSYRVPTYTNLYYTSPTTISNTDLNTEEAFSQELGLKYLSKKFNMSVAVFNRDADNLIDYVRENTTDAWQAQNIQSVNTKGYETQMDYLFSLNNLQQKIQLGYAYLDNDVKESDANFSQYSINSMKHQFTSSLQFNFFKGFNTTFAYRYVERTSGISYNVYDTNISYRIKAIEFSMFANNIFNEEYVESGMIPMPKGNALFGLKYFF
ncbi:TonB-dependent receptor plug domain-containing protein [Flavobacterium haoranii]|uniref:Iron complex outermembrane recepter protein n=1 Tax=Flavobacterium haoranii TaxID=683124 RepID=A0A1M6F7E2_9FLAO|nr:TonB-dependent receptor [Flavobacterium haoranii]SHI93593.1 iron complex outermembrane recepter protein [Flavobacterium haoranii]